MNASLTRSALLASMLIMPAHAVEFAGSRSITLKPTQESQAQAMALQQGMTNTSIASATKKYESSQLLIYFVQTNVVTDNFIERRILILKGNDSIGLSDTGVIRNLAVESNFVEQLARFTFDDHEGRLLLKDDATPNLAYQILSALHNRQYHLELEKPAHISPSHDPNEFILAMDFRRFKSIAWDAARQTGTISYFPETKLPNEIGACWFTFTMAGTELIITSFFLQTGYI